MKQYLRFTLLLLMTLVIGGGKMFAEDTAYKTLTFSADYCEKSQSYTGTWKATIGSDAWSIYAFNNSNNSWSYIKCGRKNYASVAYIRNANTFDKAISKIVVTIDKITKNNVKSIYLLVCSDADCKNAVDTVKLADLAAGDKEFSISTQNQSASNYYNLVFDCNAGSSNGLIQVSKVAYYAAADDGRTATTTSFTDITTGETKTVSMYEQLSAAATVKAGEGTVSDAEVTYSSSNTAIATVEADGSVKTQSPGKAVITASYAGDDTYSPSSASFNLVIKAGAESIMDMQSEIDKNQSENILADLTFKDVYVTGGNENSAYISDGNYGMLIYTKDHGLTKGNVLNGTVENATLCLYNGAYEITDFSSTNLTITTTELTPAETTISSITKSNIGKYVTVKSLTYDASEATFTDADGNSIAYYDGLSTSVELISGNKYDITGVVGYHNALQLMPTEATALSKTATLKTDTDPLTSLNVDATDSYTITYEGDGTVSVISSDTDVATAAYDDDTKTVTITGVAKGEATITISATAGETYGIPTPISYDLNVIFADEMTETFKYSDEDIKGQGVSGATGKGAFSAEKENITFATTDGYGHASYLQIYGNASITLTAKEGYAICGVKLTGTTTTYIRSWQDQDGANLTKSGTEATWSGIGTSVVINNTTSSQARLTSIEVSYLKLTDSGKTVTIGEDGKATYCAEANCIIGDGTVTKYITGTESNGTTLTEKDAQVVAAGEGVLLNGKAGDYKVYTHSLLEAAKNADNKLVGCAEATTVPAGAYVMQKQNNCVAFYLVAESTTITCPAGKAYLSALSSDAKALFFVDGETTGINSAEISSEETTGDIYTLSGVKVNKADLTKGIYIMNGKKYIVK